MSSVTIVLYTSKTLKNGQHPIMLRVIKDRKSYYKSTGYSSLLEHWDVNKELPNKKHPLYKDLSILLQAKKLEVDSEKMNLERSNENFSPQQVLGIVKASSKSTKIIDYISEIITELVKNGKIGNSIAYGDCKRALSRFMGKDVVNLSFSAIDVSFLRKFEGYLIGTGLKESSVSVYMRTLRAVFNRAIQDKLIKKDLYPFDDYKISKLSVQAHHRALDKSKLELILKLKLDENDAGFHSHNFFVFSYYCWGINLMDIGLLKWKNIQGNRLVYVRAKTGKLYNIPILEPAQRILDFYKEYQLSIDLEDYVFPILDAKIHITPLQIKYRTQKINKRTNKDLQVIAEHLGIEEKITTYVARHSFATNLRDLDVSTSKIQHMMGHTSERTTQGYLDSFKNNELDDAAQLLL